MHTAETSRAVLKLFSHNGQRGDNQLLSRITQKVVDTSEDNFLCRHRMARRQIDLFLAPLPTGRFPKSLISKSYSRPTHVFL